MEEVFKRSRPPDDIRPQVAMFAGLMELVLRDNDHKGGWWECDALWLLAKLGEEFGELSRVLVKMSGPSGYGLLSLYDDPLRYSNPAEFNKPILEAIREAVDTGNVAMMIADILSQQLAEE